MAATAAVTVPLAISNKNQVNDADYNPNSELRNKISYNDFKILKKNFHEISTPKFNQPIKTNLSLINSRLITEIFSNNSLVWKCLWSLNLETDFDEDEINCKDKGTGVSLRIFKVLTTNNQGEKEELICHHQMHNRLGAIYNFKE